MRVRADRLAGWLGAAALLAAASCATPAPELPQAVDADPANSVEAAFDYDILIKGGTVYDGSGGTPYVADIAVADGRIFAVYPKLTGEARMTIDAHGLAVSPGFINMLSWATDNLLADGRGLSDLKQGVTLEVMGEGASMGPYTEAMKARETAHQGDIKYDIDWTTLDEYLRRLERQGVAVNVASMVGASTVREYVIGEGDVDPTPRELVLMQAQVAKAMEDGALGVGSALIYAPGSYAETDELVALAAEAGRCGGLYTSHIRYESDRLLEGIDEIIEIARRSGAPAEIYHLKAAGRTNWDKLDAAIASIEAARAEGLRITADMYTYTAGSTGLDAAMPPWVQADGTEAWIARLKDPETRARVIAQMRDAGAPYENLYRHAGAEGTLLIGFKNAALKPLTGRTLAEVAAERGVSPEDAAIDLVIADGSRVQVVYFLMSEDNVRRQTALPWMSFGSDASAQAPEGAVLLSSTHPRAYGNFARLLGKYVRQDKALSLAEAIRKLTSQPAATLGLKERGRLMPGWHADIVVFDPKQIADKATYEDPRQFAVGVSEVIVGGELALSDGEFTGAYPGKVVRGRAWRGWGGDGGCREFATDWDWAW